MKKEEKKIQITIDKGLAEDAKQVFSRLGLNFTTAIHLYFKRVVANDGIPFDLSLSEEELVDQELAKASKLIPEKVLHSPEEIMAWLDEEE